MTDADAVLLIGFGGPTAPAEIRPFLDNVLRGRAVAPERIEEVVRHYQAIGGRSPFNELTFAQARALQALLAREGAAVPVFVGLRNWAPYVNETLAEIARQGYRRVAGLVLSALRCEASWQRYQEGVGQALALLGAGRPQVRYAGEWHDHPLFIEAAAACVSEALARLPSGSQADARLIFTAHSIPAAMAAASSYAEQFHRASALVATRLGHRNWSIAYQSRSGHPREPWLEPDVGEILRRYTGGGVVVMPLGFICDHVEVLYDLDVEAAGIARARGLPMVRARTVGTDPRFIAMMGQLIREISW